MQFFLTTDNYNNNDATCIFIVCVDGFIYIMYLCNNNGALISYANIFSFNVLI